MTESPPPPDITPEMFSKWRSAVRGSGNPERMTNPVWKWLIESRLSAYQANEVFKGPTSDTPGWCFDRFGQSCTELPDGRTVWIAGEHEDYYDPDFFIYNDVVVASPDGDIQIFGYSPEVFPPTDFHTATLLNEQILLVGTVGYKTSRCEGITQVLSLGLDHWQVSSVHTEGIGPGWIHRHSARLQDDGRAVVITGGLVDRCVGASLIENIDDWRLGLEDWRWERLTMRRWPRFEVYRKDKGRLHLWEMGHALWSKQYGGKDAAEAERKLHAELGSPAKLDILPALYRPEITHEELPEDPDDFRVHRIRIDAVLVRYVEGSFQVQVTVEGDLPADAVEQIRCDLTEKLEALEQAPIDFRMIPPA